MCLSAISATADNFSIGPCTDLDLLNDMRGVSGSSSPPDPLSDGPGLEVGTPKGVWADTWIPFDWQNFTSSSCLQKGCNSTYKKPTINELTTSEFKGSLWINHSRSWKHKILNRLIINDSKGKKKRHEDSISITSKLKVQLLSIK